ncbi:hypothetical protein [Clostridium sp. OS1-26]|uniref:hypothetical protein n=1 Tax=Clostridium sp. OS1-26 TaxID=3070681 RepID=UPI0027E116ED|nr:hypothetical protein [Clostridium sp. OS1-26]WML32861.1 hypothetical protein RCG18_16015 [Clostridium sp. OS1-26]
MNLNKKFITIGLVLLTLSWVANIFFYEKHILKETIFIKHYYDIQSGMNNVQFYYIQDINSQEQVANIEFPEIGQEYVSFTDSDRNSDNRYYKLKCISVNFGSIDQNKVSDNLKNKVITKAKVTFTNGKVINEDIGKICFYYDNQNNTTLTMANATSSSDNTGSSTHRATKDTKVTGLYTKFPDVIEDIVSMKINGKPLKDIKFPLELKAGDNLEVSYEFKFNKNDIRRNNAYNFPIDILTEDTDGTKGHSLFFMNYWLQSPGKYDIQSLRIGRR